MPIIEVILGDITQISADAIVNAANSSLLGGGGVDGAIHRAGGSQILDECKIIRAEQGGCRTGQAVVTIAGNLSANFVIHTVGPIWQGGQNQEPKLLRQCYRNCFSQAEKLKCESIAFPNISTGVYGYPKAQAVTEVKAVLDEQLANLKWIKRILFVCYDQDSFQIYQQTLHDLLSMPANQSE
ncbi:O-acetyl-ADP-ribose deacetylase (regulator of RNase III), contains Macro domain [Acinetobacter marinus]|uniref:O-acetyl-ADP-ribose deacetylase (Regulator of RNase III), contains Macro domain n=1 Tax=Acinetobacter marinus TaxID=281375 RepID=A0A1G6JMY1_9GAMM|nr:O-acetyl-ADP-ribose deacetylase [Acinetobacter marinus]SDC20063.1 O-acetyl-ADP-ribose deacetylase (regulator of RNase III), contains Macro domain [Acinetobacter marinus]